jgi:predicted acetyltransferase
VDLSRIWINQIGGQIKMEFRALSYQEVEMVRQWRQAVPQALRTPRSLTYEQQQDFYQNVVCNRDANAYYWGIWYDEELIGQAGIESIEWTNRRGEISLLLNPELRQKGLGSAAVDILLHKGFLELNLDSVYGECYTCNPAKDFWLKMVRFFDGESTYIPYTKYWNGVYYKSLWFNFFKEDYQAAII